MTTAGRLIAIGDIHGCAHELETLLGGVRPEAGDTVACVGDYIDRGPDSRAVIDRLLTLGAQAGVTTVFLKGNHEDMCLAYLGRPGRWGESWQMNGGASTLRSYGLDARLPGAEVAAALPATHLRFLEKLEPSYVTPKHLLVHAGIRPDRAWGEQDEEDLLWIREEFIARRHDLPQTVVFGHTPHRRVLVDLPWKVGIDTGCVYGGCLTGIDLGSGRLWQVPKGERRVLESSLG